MHGSSRSIVSMHILNNATRYYLLFICWFMCFLPENLFWLFYPLLLLLSRNDDINDPTTIKLLFDVAQSLHDSVDFSSTKQDDNQQAERLIVRFIDKVIKAHYACKFLLFVCTWTFITKWLSYPLSDFLQKWILSYIRCFNKLIWVSYTFGIFPNLSLTLHSIALLVPLTLNAGLEWNEIGPNLQFWVKHRDQICNKMNT